MIWWILQSTLMAGVMAAIAGLACRLRRISPALQHALWLLVLVKLLTPPVLVWPWRLPDVTALAGPRPAPEISAPQLPPHDVLAPEPLSPLGSPPRESTAETAEDHAMVQTSAAALLPVEVTVSVEQDTDSFVGGNAPAERGAPLLLAPAPARAPPASADREARREWKAGARESRRSIAPPFTSWVPLLFPAWLCGAVALLAVEALRLRGLARLLGRARPAPRGLVTIVGDVARGIGVRAPSVLVAGALSSPILACLGRPRLVFPTTLVARLGDEGCRSAAAHELAHLRRRDHWVGWLELAGEILLWWNPLYWHVRRRLRESAELACDAWVVWALPGSRKAYAEALIEVCRLEVEGREPLPALGMGGGPRTMFFQRRLTMILLERVRCKTSLAGLLCAGLLALAFLPAWAQETPAAPAAPSSASPAAGLALAPEAPPAPPAPPPVQPPPPPAPVPPPPAQAPPPPAPEAPIIPGAPQSPPSVSAAPPAALNAPPQAAPAPEALPARNSAAPAISASSEEPVAVESEAPSSEEGASVSEPEPSRNSGLERAPARSSGRNVGDPFGPGTGTSEAPQPGSWPKARVRPVQATPRTTGRRAVSAAAPGVSVGTDERLAKLEAQLQQLVAEMASLRAEISGKNRRQGATTGLPTVPGGMVLGSRRSTDQATEATSQVVITTKDGATQVAQTPDSPYEETVTVPRGVTRTRTTHVRTTTYNLSKEKAEALADFLKENVDFDLRVAVGDDGLIVTGDEEANAAIRSLITIMTRKKPAPSTRPAAQEPAASQSR
jgi:beta-lactamase regulating signal transducer with metallopeptidase domain